MNFIKMLNLVSDMVPYWLIVSTGYILAFVITVVTIPVIVRVARLKNLCAIPNKRSSHSNAVPNLGGVALFIGFIISTLIITGDQFQGISYILSSLIILFFIGMKDDILVIDPKKKLAVQFMVAFMLAVFADIRINTFFEIFNIGTLPYIPSVLISVFLIVLIINGFNLIDGIDGLAAGTGVIASVAFGLWFWHIEVLEYTVMCFCLAGTLIAFFFYNVFGKENKVFMGDTGSLLIGFLVSIMVIRFLQSDQSFILRMETESSPSLALSVIILPIFDTLRIFIIRIAQKKSPFIADHQHLHHRLLQMGYSHFKSTLILMSVNMFVLFFCFFLQGLGDLLLISIVLAMMTISSYVLLRMAKKNLVKPARVTLRQVKNQGSEQHRQEVYAKEIQKVEAMQN